MKLVCVGLIILFFGHYCFEAINTSVKVNQTNALFSSPCVKRNVYRSLMQIFHTSNNTYITLFLMFVR